MKNKFIGYICLLYFIIISYICITDKLHLFLAPQMHIYVYLALPVLILMFVVVMFNKIHYHFKITDLFLLLPLIALILSGDSKLSLSYSSNSFGNFTNKEDTIVVDILKEEVKEPSKNKNEETKELEKDNIKEYDFINPYFDIKDDIFVSITEYLSFDKKAKKYEGKTIKMRGFAVLDNPYIPSEYKIFGKYQISCCAADSFISGMLIKYDGNLKENTWYEIEGVLEKVKSNGYYILAIKVVNIKQINGDDERYVYPCYAYGDGSCNQLFKYDLK